MNAIKIKKFVMACNLDALLDPVMVSDGLPVLCAQDVHQSVVQAMWVVIM